MTRRTKTGRTLTDAELDALATEVENTDYDVETLKQQRRPGRPAMGSGPADVVPVRIDPELRAAIEARAEAESTTTSAVIREALRKFLDVA
jgi:hypothetical protein